MAKETSLVLNLLGGASCKAKTLHPNINVGHEVSLHAHSWILATSILGPNFDQCTSKLGT